ncbi:hypothetical protein KBB48_03180 [Candidatus Shapirobacteria bacterium]|nr:hypothetical protein [Candidatus Shapirobacteria bacterium]
MSLDKNSRPYFRLIDGIVDSGPFHQRVGLAEITIKSVLLSKKQAAILPVEASREIGITPALRNGDRFNRVQLNEQQMKKLAQSAVDAALKVEVGREMAKMLSRTGNLNFDRTMRTIDSKFSRIKNILYGGNDSAFLSDLLVYYKEGIQLALLAPEVKRFARTAIRGSQQDFTSGRQALTRIDPSRARSAVLGIRETTSQIVNLESHSPLVMQCLDPNYLTLSEENIDSNEFEAYLERVKNSGGLLDEEAKLRKKRYQQTEDLAKQVGNLVGAVMKVENARMSDEVARKYLGLEIAFRVSGFMVIMSGIKAQMAIAEACSRDLIGAALEGDISPRRIEDSLAPAMAKVSQQSDLNLIN